MQKAENKPERTGVKEKMYDKTRKIEVSLWGGMGTKRENQAKPIGGVKEANRGKNQKAGHCFHFEQGSVSIPRKGKKKTPQVPKKDREDDRRTKKVYEKEREERKKGEKRASFGNRGRELHLSFSGEKREEVNKGEQLREKE